MISSQSYESISSKFIGYGTATSLQIGGIYVKAPGDGLVGWVFTKPLFIPRLALNVGCKVSAIVITSQAQ
jgi:hypothetical protein